MHEILNENQPKDGKVNYMSMLEPRYIVKSGVMEGYTQYLILNNKMSQSKARIHVNLVRKFQNYVGKPYVDIEKRDILSYLFYLGEREHLTHRSIDRYLSAIKKFYEYLWNRGDVAKLPSEGVSIKKLKRFKTAHKQ